MIRESYKVLDRLRLPHGLYLASTSDHYRYVWLRDSVYMSLPYLDKADGTFEKAFHRILDLLTDYEWKLDLIVGQKPVYEWEYLHARYSSSDVREIHSEPWGHVQHDMIGAILFGIGTGESKGRQVIRSVKDLELVGKLIRYLERIEYWRDPDNGMWEEGRELHSSSIGACVAGLDAVQRLVQVPQRLIDLGREALRTLYPRESESKPADLAQLSLVYPYRLLTGERGEAIVRQVEEQLLRERGVIRYSGDSYYSVLEEEHGRGHDQAFYKGSEAEWTFGLPWLALCWLELGDRNKAMDYVRQTERAMVEPGVLPELFFAGTAEPNPNTPLGWSSAMYILAAEALERAQAGANAGD
ncbi:glycoside hydrolase family 15 protein [Paenibacillus contaminans]|uniref:Glycoside hydrolase family 15 n=1 Tax=Paenibacillus contaminans TaxID=450362 RepID=A0A329LUW0_9BACL|nr:glycoside hydrolase family 15 protein [Paenibacillus contaminans]RAV11238.1 glycoside hydrolase family 15 [Paenibacillus contaminans]